MIILVLFGWAAFIFVLNQFAFYIINLVLVLLLIDGRLISFTDAHKTKITLMLRNVTGRAGWLTWQWRQRQWEWRSIISKHTWLPIWRNRQIRQCNQPCHLQIANRLSLRPVPTSHHTTHKTSAQTTQSFTAKSIIPDELITEK